MKISYADTRKFDYMLEDNRFEESDKRDSFIEAKTAELLGDDYDPWLSCNIAECLDEEEGGSLYCKIIDSDEVGDYEKSWVLLKEMLEKYWETQAAKRAEYLADCDNDDYDFCFE